MTRRPSTADSELLHEGRCTVERFTRWLESYGETSYDHQTFFASDIGRAAKALYYRNRLLGVLAVAPMISVEALVPAARQLFWKPQRFPIADAHYASGFAFLAATTGDDAHHARAVHFLDVLIETRSKGFERYAWGYPFDWVTVNGTLTAGTPMITTLPYVYEAFAQVYELDRNPRWRDVMASLAEHALLDFQEHPTSADAASCSYTPNASDRGGVVNASAYRAFLLTKAGHDFGRAQYLQAAQRNLNFVLQAQNADGSWYYAVDEVRDFIDHFHTCFVLKALSKIESLTQDPRCREAIERGVSYYVRELFDDEGLPKPFSRRPRLTVYRRELYDYAECLNLGVLLRGRFPPLDQRFDTTLRDTFACWRKADGSFRARQLLVGWDNVPMHRWAQSQMFRSLSQFLYACAGEGKG